MTSASPAGHARLNDKYGHIPASGDGQALVLSWSKKRNYLQSSASDWAPVVTATFAAMRAECGAADWDGPGSIAVTEGVLDIAMRAVGALYALLPAGTPAPDVVPEADGEVCVSWYVDARRGFSLSLGAHGKVNFAGEFGTEGAVHGWQPIDTSSEWRLAQSLQDVVRSVAKLYPPVGARRAA